MNMQWRTMCSQCSHVLRITEQYSRSKNNTARPHFSSYYLSFIYYIICMICILPSVSWNENCFVCFLLSGHHCYRWFWLNTWIHSSKRFRGDCGKYPYPFSGRITICYCGAIYTTAVMQWCIICFSHHQINIFLCFQYKKKKKMFKNFNSVGTSINCKLNTDCQVILEFPCRIFQINH